MSHKQLREEVRKSYLRTLLIMGAHDAEQRAEELAKERVKF